MSSSDENQRQSRRAAIYQALSATYYSPTPELEESLEQLPDALRASQPELAPLAEELLAEFKRQSSDLTNLKVDHARLFVGPAELLAAPYGSVYLEEGRRIMGDTTMEALEHYRAVGLKSNQEISQPPDFIATELEFIFFLGHCYLQTGEEEYLRRQDDFLRQHPGRWVEPFTEKIVAGAEEEFYRLLGKLTGEFIRAELQATQG